MRETEEKRSYYRIKDSVGLRYTLLDGKAAVSELPSGAADTPVARQLADLDREFNQLTNTLWLENPLMGQALGLLNRKLSLIADLALPGDEHARQQRYEELLVSLSGSGIGFGSHENLAPGVRLHLLLELRPSNITLALTGLVTGSELLAGAGDKTYWVRVTFEAGNEAAQEQLIQHVVQRQCAQISEQPGTARE